MAARPLALRGAGHVAIAELRAVDRLGGVRGVRPAAVRRGGRWLRAFGVRAACNTSRADPRAALASGFRRAGDLVRSVRCGEPGARHGGGRRRPVQLVPGLWGSTEQLARLQEPAVRRARVAAAAARDQTRRDAGRAAPGVRHAGGADHRDLGRGVGARGIPRPVELRRQVSHHRAVLGDACRRRGDRCLPGAGHTVRRVGAVVFAYAAALGGRGRIGAAHGLRLPHDVLARRLRCRGRPAGPAGPVARRPAQR